ncbi:hypothetical protein F4781DRAFT_385575 [Annulohypoxylon bovei var. microspora]|nr:hypothetical protein F4781DRAFT_385575 [Annulohypoxylon bovei var. microspora]
MPSTSSDRAVASSHSSEADIADDYHIVGSHEGALVDPKDTDLVTFSMLKAYYVLKESSGWTNDADGVLCLMKTKKWSWKLISNVLQRSIEDAKERFAYLTELARRGSVPTAILGELFFIEMSESSELLDDVATRAAQFEEAKAKLDKQHVRHHVASLASKTRRQDKAQRAAHAGAVPGRDHYDGLNYRDLAFAQNNTPRSGPTSASTSVSTGNSNMSEKGGDSVETDIKVSKKTSDEEEAEEMASQLKSDDLIDIYAAQYKELKKLRSDDHFSDLDCKVLAVVEARYRCEKYLRIASDFANMTGRSISPEIVMAKLEGAQTMDRLMSALWYGFDAAEFLKD